MSVTIKDVARKANVSISTVSRVINRSKPVSDEVKKRVLEVIEEIGYTPNPVARNLVMKKSHLIGVIVPDIASFYIGELLAAAEEIAKTYGYELILCNSYGELKQELRYLELLKNKQVEGIIFMTYRLRDKHKAFIKNNKLPVIMVNRDGREIDVPTVSVDHYQATYDMVEYLIKNGHEKISLIRNGQTQDVFGIDQLKGYKDALEENNIEYDESCVFTGRFLAENAYKAVEQMILEKNVPTAIVATSDITAIGAMNALFDNGYKVPEHVSVVSFYDTKLAKLYRPKLTTIKQPIYDIGALAVRRLIKIIKGENEENDILIMPHELVKRDSDKEL